MKAGAMLAGLACMAVLHNPDGREINAEIGHIGLITPAEQHAAKGQIAAGTKSIVYIDGKPWGVIESAEQVRQAIHNCVDGEH